MKKKRLDVKSGKVLEVLRFFDIKVDKDLVERIFVSNNKNYMECSIKNCVIDWYIMSTKMF